MKLITKQFSLLSELTKMLLIMLIIPLFLHVEPWTLVPPDNPPDENHFLKELEPTTICADKVVKIAKVKVLEELDDMYEKIELTTERITNFTDETIKTYKSGTMFKTLNGIRIKVGKTAKDYKTATKECDADDSSLVEITNANFKTVKALITTLSPSNKDVWIPVIPLKQPTYESKEKIPAELCGKSTKVNLDNIYNSQICAYINLDSLTFSTEDCSTLKYYLCKSKIQPNQLAEIILLKENFLTLKYQFKTVSDQIKLQLKKLPTTKETTKQKRNLFKPENIEIIGGINTSRLPILKTISEFVRNKVEAIENYNNFLETKSMNLIYSTSQIETSTTQPTTNATNASTISTTTSLPTTTTTNLNQASDTSDEPYYYVEETYSNEMELLIKYGKISRCSKSRVFETYPINNSVPNIHKNITFINNICRIVSIPCYNIACHKETLQTDLCCSNIFNKTTHFCESEDVFPSFVTKNETTLIFSGQNIWVNDTCGNKIYTNVGKFDLDANSSCKITSTLPFVTYPLKANFSKNFRGRDNDLITEKNFTMENNKNTSSSSSPIIYKILPYASTLASLFSGLMLIISLIICCRYKNKQSNKSHINRKPINKDSETTNSWWCCCCNKNQANQQQQGFEAPQEIQLQIRKPCLKKNKRLEEEMSFHSSGDSE